MNYIEINNHYQWIIRVIDSSIGDPELECCFKLIDRFNIIHPKMSTTMGECLIALLNDKIRVLNGNS